MVSLYQQSNNDQNDPKLQSFTNFKGTKTSKSEYAYFYIKTTIQVCVKGLNFYVSKDST